MSQKISLSKDTKVPDHVAIIPDGNRRWARAKGLHTLQGHKKGFDRAVELGRVAREWGIHTVTLWGFSTENWDRTKEEIDYLMRLYVKLVDDYLVEAKENGVRIYHLGRKDRLPDFLLKKLAKAEKETEHFTKFIMNICLDYGGHDEIIRAVQEMIKDGIKAQDVDKNLFENYLDTKKQPFPYVDLMIRTSGEQRTSGLLLWQSQYSEFYWEAGHFPDFTPDKFKESILDYSRRRRRFGGNDAMEHFGFKPELAARLEISWIRLANIPKGEKFMDYAIRHLKEQYGLSKKLAVEAAKYLTEALLEEKKEKWHKAKARLKSFYKLIKNELKLAFEPELVASLEVRMRQQIGQDEAEGTARELLGEVYRISLFQAAKAAHLRVLASVEAKLGNWDKAEDYLQKYYRALKDRVA